MALNPLRNIPSVNEILENPVLRRLVQRINQNVVVSTVRSVLDEVRQEVQTAATERSLPSVAELADRIARRVMETEHHGVTAVINATGVLLAPDLGGPPLAEEALAELAAMARDYAAVDLDPATGQPAARDDAVGQLLREITGAEAAWVAQSSGAALLATMAALAAGREVVVSRGELLELADGSRLPDLLSAGGAAVREVGTANCTRADDYESACGPQTAAVLRVDGGDFSPCGRAESVGLAESAELARRRGLPLIHHLGGGALVDLTPVGLTGMPSAAESVKSGVDLVLLSGDGLVGGPSCGIVLGRRTIVASIERSPLARALRAGKIALAALAATLCAYREPDRAWRDIPLLGLLGTSIENLRNRAQRMAPQIAASRAVAEAVATEGTASLWGGPARTLPTWCVTVKPAGMNVERLAALLGSSTPAVLGRRDADWLVFDLRSVVPRQDQQLVAAILAAGGEGESG